MALIQEATELLRQSEDDGFSQNLSFQADITAKLPANEEDHALLF